MDTSGLYLKKALITIILFMAILTFAVDGVLFLGLDKLHFVVKQLSQIMISGMDLVPEEVSAHLVQFEYYQNIFASWFIPLSSIFFAFFGLFLWLVLKSHFNKHFKNSNKENNVKSKKDFADQRIEQEQKQRLFLHTLSILQREGRLLDFFDEDLKNYDDEQIGMAVRSIQEDCKKAMRKYAAIKPIYQQEEGEMIELSADFDTDAVKLVGNVSGKPPFKGVLKHRGWMAGKKEIPKLSETKDPTIITPAEVEIK